MLLKAGALIGLALAFGALIIAEVTATRYGTASAPCASGVAGLHRDRPCHRDEGLLIGESARDNAADRRCHHGSMDVLVDPSAHAAPWEELLVGARSVPRRSRIGLARDRRHRARNAVVPRSADSIEPDIFRAGGLTVLPDADRAANIAAPDFVRPVHLAEYRRLIRYRAGWRRSSSGPRTACSRRGKRPPAAVREWRTPQRRRSSTTSIRLRHGDGQLSGDGGIYRAATANRDLASFHLRGARRQGDPHLASLARRRGLRPRVIANATGTIKMLRGTILKRSKAPAGPTLRRTSCDALPTTA